MLGDKFRFRFGKTGTLRLLSHHDLMRCLERMLRRASLPFKSTAGFHPGPRVVFALSLPLGVAGLDEVVEIEFTQSCDPTEVLGRLQTQAPIGLTFTRVSTIPLKTTAIPRRIEYRLPVPPERIAAVGDRCGALLAQSQVWVNRFKPSPKQLNIRPYLRDLRIESRDSHERDQAYLSLDLWVTQTGTARADELLDLLDVAGLVNAGAVVERTTLEIHDEVCTPVPADVPPAGPAETRPLDPAAIAARERRAAEQAAAAVWEVIPAGPVVE